MSLTYLRGLLGKRVLWPVVSQRLFSLLFEDALPEPLESTGIWFYTQSLPKSFTVVESLAFTRENFSMKARWVWVARTGKGHAVPGLGHSRPSGAGFRVVPQGSPGVASGREDGHCGVGAPQPSATASPEFCSVHTG